MNNKTVVVTSIYILLIINQRLYFISLFSTTLDKSSYNFGLHLVRFPNQLPSDLLYFIEKFLA